MQTKFAAIDVGSNALRLRIIEAQSPDVWREIDASRASVRLGREVFVTGRLSSAAIAEATAALRGFREAMDLAGVTSYRAVATSAVREASNGAVLVERARREAGIEIETIEGVEEARLVQLAVSRRMTLGGRTLLVDVGGGSTELCLLERGRNVFSISLALGTVRMLETYLAPSSSTSAQRGLHGNSAGALGRRAFRVMCEGVDRALAEALPRLGRVERIVGTGGNMDALAALSKAEQGVADVPTMRALLIRMSAMTPAVRARTFGLRPDRADTIVPAAAIFVRLAESLRIATVLAPGVGVKDGVLAELALRHFRIWDAAGHDESVLDACRRLGRRYQWDEAHADRVASFAGRLFDDLTPLHRYGRRERLLLSAAALLHDIGDFVRYDAHHKHSQYIIENSDIMGLSAEEHAIVANLARYHRKSTPQMAHATFAALGKSARAKVRALSAILRIADALDREHRGKVERVRARIQDKAVVLSIHGSAGRELEEWTVLAKAGPFRDVFGLEVVLSTPKRRARKELAA
jgi:exopolyphosphatase/guanosine-5'-triphosphate,3'-diphosphate pyrophosphatase